MSATRSRLTLDEQSFERLLAAAFTIQEHNDREKRASTAKPISELVPPFRKIIEARCPHCAVPLVDGEAVCPKCGSERFRPGERMQQKFASLWEMSQDQGVRRDPGERTEPLPELSPPPEESQSPVGEEIRIIEALEESTTAEPREERASAEQGWLSRFPELQELQQTPEPPESHSFLERAIAKLRTQSMNFPRADLYLGLAILVAAVALLWPTPVAPRAHLRPWQRILVRMGIAEQPAAAVHYRGNPNAQVWVDPHTALYYCPGEEQYGKTVNGRFTDQREAQLEQFEPAGRSVCP
jgi:uncharacterized Zn finger protein (UPF0148 family)